LRTAEFFVARRTHNILRYKTEAIETEQMVKSMQILQKEEHIASPVIQGIKTESERFAGAENLLY
jgi:prolyl-tRNA synthetase